MSLAEIALGCFLAVKAVMVGHKEEPEKDREPTEKKKKLSSKQDNPEAQFLTFCHHYFVCNPGDNAEAVARYWRHTDQDQSYPRARVGEWFNTLRQNLRYRIKVPCSHKIAFLSKIYIFF